MYHFYRLNGTLLPISGCSILVYGQCSMQCDASSSPGTERPRFAMRQLCAVLARAFGGSAFALPQGGQVASGAGAINQSGNNMTVQQSSQNLSVNWQSFSIGPGQQVRFNQPSAASIVLNRVVSQAPSEIRGTLSANGQVFLINPNGILFRSAAQVNVGGLVATSNGLSDADFQAGRYRFANNGNAGEVINRGAMTAANGGYIALLAPQVRNEGVITAQLGTALLAAGNQVTLKLDNGSLVGYNIDQGAVNALADNRQLVRADGGKVFMSAKSADQLTRAVVNNDGVIEARTIQNKAGVISLTSGLAVGEVRLGGTLDASAQSGAGGAIQTSAAQVNIARSARVSTAAPGGRTGNWLISQPGNFRIAGVGGHTTANTLAKNLGTSNITIQTTASGAEPGDIVVQNALNWSGANRLVLNAQRNVNLNAAIINGSGGNLLLRADATGSGAGTINFGASGRINLGSGGSADLYYNPSSYSAPKNFASSIAGPYTAWMLVNNANNLQAMNTNRSGNYALGKDIDASATAGWNGGAGFAPVGSDLTAVFSGRFDGMNRIIKGLVINRPNSDYVGLFGVASGQIANVGLVGGKIIGGFNVGTLVAFNQGGTISNAYNTGTVSGDSFIGGLIGENNFGQVTDVYNTGAVTSVNSMVGGVVGINTGALNRAYNTGEIRSTGSMVGGVAGRNSGAISNAYNTGKITTTQGAVGGIVGYVDSGSIDRTYNTGAISGSDNAGGVAGIGADAIVNISNSYSTGAVSATEFAAGGLIGGHDIGTISNCYATGTVTGGSSIGGLAGYSMHGTVRNTYSSGKVSGSANAGGLIGGFGFEDNTDIHNSYWDKGASGQTASAGGTGMTSAQMKQKTSFTGFDFVNVWRINEGQGSPWLRMLPPPGP